MSKPIIVVTDYTFPDLEKEQAAAHAAGYEFKAYQCKNADQVCEALVGASIAIVQFAEVNAKAIAGMAPNAALIRYGIGYENIDVNAANERGFPVGYVPDYCLDEVAEHTSAALLMLLRKLPTLDKSVRDGQWNAVKYAKPLKPFNETLVGFYGFGQIGRSVHKKLKSFGFKFAVSDPSLSLDEAKTLGVTKLSAEDLFKQVDAITLHAPVTKETENFVNKARLNSMKNHAILVNSSRGALIDEDAIANALNTGQIAGAALDVFHEEPLLPDSPLRDAQNLMLSPHGAWYSERAIGQLQSLVADDVSNHIEGRKLRKPVPGSTGSK
ncbi:MAG: C-terminal binding protein [Rhizobiales bacterium]|nr:C-terminal binding protein [Hyphomicrobiales bacterium]NRB15441.1 C-terminal binding protein [Hyphomicrobiales bacterium]